MTQINSEMKSSRIEFTRSSLRNSLRLNRNFQHVYPPPIFVLSHDSFLSLRDRLSHTKVTFKARKDALVVYPDTEESHVQAVNELKKMKTEFYTFPLKTDKAFRVKIKYLSPSVPEEMVKKELEKLGFRVRRVGVAKELKTGAPLPTFFVELEPGEGSSRVLQVRRLLDTKVEVEECQDVELPQCRNCQDYGHEQEACSRPTRCAKCAGPHLSRKCPTARTVAPVCALCGGPHPATYKGCVVYKCYVRESRASPGSNDPLSRDNLVTFLLSNSEDQSNKSQQSIPARLADGVQENKEQGSTSDVGTTSSNYHYSTEELTNSEPPSYIEAVAQGLLEQTNSLIHHIRESTARPPALEAALPVKPVRAETPTPRPESINYNQPTPRMESKSTHHTSQEMINTNIPTQLPLKPVLPVKPVRAETSTPRPESSNYNQPITSTLPVEPVQAGTSTPRPESTKYNEHITSTALPVEPVTTETSTPRPESSNYNQPIPSMEVKATHHTSQEMINGYIPTQPPLKPLPVEPVQAETSTPQPESINYNQLITSMESKSTHHTSQEINGYIPTQPPLKPALVPTRTSPHTSQEMINRNIPTQPPLKPVLPVKPVRAETSRPRPESISYNQPIASTSLLHARRTHDTSEETINNNIPTQPPLRLKVRELVRRLDLGLESGLRQLRAELEGNQPISREAMEAERSGGQPYMTGSRTAAIKLRFSSHNTRDDQ